MCVYVCKSHKTHFQTIIVYKSLLCAFNPQNASRRQSSAIKVENKTNTKLIY